MKKHNKEELATMTDQELKNLLINLEENKSIDPLPETPFCPEFSNHVMTLAFKHRLTLSPMADYDDTFDPDLYSADAEIGEEETASFITVWDKNPYRAAVIVLILLLQDKQDENV